MNEVNIFDIFLEKDVCCHSDKLLNISGTCKESEKFQSIPEEIPLKSLDIWQRKAY